MAGPPADTWNVPAPATPTSDRLPFWKRQIAPEITIGQMVFDVVAGILVPLGCLLLDPIVFRPRGLLQRHALFAYATIGLSFLSLAVWLSCRRPASLLAGALAAGAVFSFVLGVLLLPYSTMGLLAIIGVLGFAPFLTSFVYWRNSLRAYALGPASRGAAGADALTRRLAAAVAFVLVVGLPWATLTVVNRETARVTEVALSSGDLATSVATLKRMRWLVDTDSFVWTYEKEKAPERRQRLAELYRSLTGREIEQRLVQLSD